MTSVRGFSKGGPAHPRWQHRPEWLITRGGAAVWCGLVGVALLLGVENSTPVSHGWLGPAAALMAIVASLLLPLERLPSRLQAVGAWAAIVLLVPVQIAGLIDPHSSVIVALPLLWLALRHTREDSLVGIGLAMVGCLIPLVVLGGAPRHAPFVIISTAVAAMVASAVSRLGRQRRDSAGIGSVGYTDFLTNCANRRAWDEQIPLHLAESWRRGWPLAVAVLDLDGFTAYNEDWGHAAGDRLLTDTATALRFAERTDAASPGVALVARLGADEFAVLLEGLDRATATAVVRRLADELPGGHTVSSGIACWDTRESAGDLMNRATRALDAAGRSIGAGRIVVDDGVAGARNWLESLPSLVARGEIESVYQPIRDLATKALVGYEALARPLGAPADLRVDGMFAAARRLGISQELEILCQKAAVRGAHALLATGTCLFVNVGVGSLTDPDRDVEAMVRNLSEARLRPDQIVLEVNESITHLGRFAEATAAYRKLGFRFAMDDVGEGMSSIEAIAVVRPEIIKIARSLVTTAADNVGSAAMIRGLVETARSLGGQIIAEGVETPEHCATMAQLGATLGQGWALGRPARLHDVLVAA